MGDDPEALRCWHEPWRTGQGEITALPTGTQFPPALLPSPTWCHGSPPTQFCNSRMSILFFYLFLKFHRPKIKSPNLSIGWDPRIHAILTLGYTSSLHKASKREGAPCLLQSQVQGTLLVPGQSLWMPTFPYQFYVQLWPSRKSHALPSSRDPLCEHPWAIT